MNLPFHPSDLDAVIFDFGGVILNLDYPATDRALRKLLGEEGEIRYTKAHQSRIFDDFEVGAIDSKEFYQTLIDATDGRISQSEVREAWNAMLLDAPKARIEFVKDVAKHYRTFLFSNTNVIHKEAFDETLSAVLGGKGKFDQIFERAYYSHEFGMRKPHPETYQKVLKENNLLPSRTLMIDDNLENIKGAIAAGMKAYYLSGELLEAEALLNLLGK